MSETAQPKLRRWQTLAVMVVVVIAFVAGAALQWLIFSRDDSAAHDHRDATAAAPTTQPATSQQIETPTGVQQMYTCSMHPQVRSPNPDDKCPICGMDLIPVPLDDEPADDGEQSLLRLSQRSAALMQVQVQPAEHRDLRIPVRFYGRLAYDETGLRDVNTKVSGWIEKLHVDYTGAAVKRGQPLFDIYSPGIFSAQEEYLLALRSREAAGRNTSGVVDLVDAARMRLEYFDITPAQIAELEERGSPLKTVTIFSPHDGVIIERNAYEGMKVDPGMRLFRMADLSNLWLQFEAYETDLPWLEVGQRVAFTAQAQQGEQVEGKVAFIAPTIDPRSRTAEVRVEVDNTDGQLKPGMFVSGKIDVVLDEAPLVIPASAPLITGNRAVVYVQLRDQERPTYEARTVTLGPRAGDWYIVREGLDEHDLVVTNGAFKIDSELQIRGRPSMMQPVGGAPAGHDHGQSAAPAAAGEHSGHTLVPATEAERAAYPLDTCVVSGLALDSMSGPLRLTHNGTTVLLCCETCLPKFEADPERYLDKLPKAGGAS